MSEVKNEGLEVADVRAIVTDAFISMVEAALGMKAPDCAPPAFIQSAIDRAIDRINSEALAGYAVRDARIVELDKKYGWALSELAAIKAQEPVAFVHFCDSEIDYDSAYVISNETGDCVDDRHEWRPVYAAPVSEAKAQGVALDGSQLAGLLEQVRLDDDEAKPHGNGAVYWNNAVIACQVAIRDALASPVQQVSVQDGFVLAKETVVEMPDGSKDLGYTTIGRVGIFNSAEEVFDAIRELDLPLGWVSMTTEQLLPGWMLAAAPAAPAADAWIPVSERLPDVPDGDEREVIVCVKRAHNGQSYSFSARYLNNFPLHSDSEDEPMIVTGWHDVKEHAEYDGWYSPLIDSSSGDEVTHWMPMPAAPSAHSAKGVM